MTTNIRVLALGGERAVLVGLARAFQAAGAHFAAATDPGRTADSAARFAPNLVLAFARPSPDEALRRVAALRADARFAAIPIVLVASLPPANTRGVNLVVPDPSDVGEFAARILKLVRSSEQKPSQPAPAQAPEPSGEEIAEIDIVEEIEAIPARLLLVDDDPSLIRLFSIAIRKSGFDVLVAGDGVQGLGAALEHRPDLVIADLNMPHLDGWGLLRALRADHRVGETPLMFLSCHDDYREALKALSAGAQDYVAKGGKLDALISRIRTLLAPRDAFLGALFAREKITAKIGELGVQWSLRKMAGMRCCGTVRVRDAFWDVIVGLEEGHLTFAAAQIGQHRLSGTEALPALVALRSGDFFFDPAGRAPVRNVEGELEALLEQAAVRNNESEALALDRLLTQASKVAVDEQLYQLYEQLGPPGSREVAALVRQGLTPREVIASSTKSPMEIEDTLRDLVRRRVLHLSA